MENEVKCPNCKEGFHLQRRLENYPEEMEFYKCEVCGSVWENEKTISLKELFNSKDERILKDIRLHQRKSSIGAIIQVNYGDGWEEIKKHIEK